MAKIPNPRSYSQILGSQIGTFLSKTGLHRLKIGNPILSIFESTSQSQLRSSGDIFQLLNSANLDSATGEALRKIGRDENVLQTLAKASNGFITIIDNSFIKIASEVYQGTAAPIVGSTTVNIADASAFPSSGEIYLSRNTGNYEGPIAYSSKVDNTAYWTLNLSTPTTKYHNLGESVIVAQGGNRTISAGSIVKTAQASLQSPVQFRTNFSSTIPDGETQVSNVYIVCTKTGLAGNVGSASITSFASVPFSGAVCTNPSPFTNGREIENEDEYRERIRKARQTRALGTKLAVQQAAINVFSPDENKTVTSSSYETRIGEPDILYVDDSTGYEELPIPVNYDTLVAFASGGEQFLQLNSPTPITKAFIQTNNSAPYNLSEGQTLSVLVSGQLSEHSFSAEEFININGATAYEVVSAINGNPSLKFAARTGSGGTKVVIFAKTNTFEDIQVIANNNDANGILEFTSTPQSTLKLYKNDKLLVKDGAPAIFYSNSFYVWTALSGTQTLEIGIDNTPALSFSITDADFVDANTGYTSLGNNSLVAWAAVLNAKVPGVSFTVTGSMLSLRSNLGNNSTAQIDIVGGTLVSNNVFAVGTADGVNSDYTFDRNIGQLKLAEVLAPGDTVTASTFFTNAFIQSDVISTANLATTGKLWLGLDMDGYTTVNVPLAAGSALAIEHATDTPNYAYRIKILSTSSIFADVIVGDLVVISDENVDASLQGSWRVVAVDPTFIEIDKTNCTSERGYYPAATLLGDGRFFVSGGSVNGYPTNTAEIYDPIANNWTATPPMSYARSGHTATLLADGTVLVSGGYTTVKTTTLATGISVVSVSTPTDTAEIYDPVLDSWATAAPMADARVFHSAALIIGGADIDKILVAGGEDGAGVPMTACELYTPGSNSWAATGSLSTARSHCASCTLEGAGSGDILLAGGANFSTATVLNSAERYAIAAGTWSAASTFTTARFDGNMVNNTSNSKAELLGGINTTVGGAFQTALSRYDVVGNTWAAGASAPAARGKSAWVICDNDKIVSAGGAGSGTSDSTVIVYNSTANTWSAVLPAPSGHNVEGSVGAQIGTNIVVYSHGSISKTDFLTTTEKPAAAATSYLFDASANTFDYTDPSIDPAVSLLDGGINVARTLYAPEYVEIPSGATYTATSLATEINADIVGASAVTYKTNSIRISTNTDDVSIGGIGLIGANSAGQELLIDISDEVANLTGHVGSVESGTSEISTVNEPGLLLDGAGSGNWINLLRHPTFNPLQLSENLLFGEQFTRLGSDDIVSNFGAARWFYSQINSQQSDFSVELDQTSSIPLAPGSSINAMLPYVLSAYDTLSVLIDGDAISRSYNVNMFRNLTTDGTTYSITNTFTDADHSGDSLAVAFGFGSNSFDFENFAVHMAARTKAHPSDASKRILYRFNKLGPDGNYCLLEYALPDGPSEAIKQDVLFASEDSNDRDIIQIKLASGAALTGIEISSNAKIGVAATVIGVDGTATVIFAMGLAVNNGARTSNVTTITVVLPPNVTDHGIQVNDQIHFFGSGSFATGLYVITGRTATTLSYAETGADVVSGAITGNVSMDSRLDTMATASPAVAVGQFFRLGETADISTPTVVTERTMRITAKGDQYLEGKFRGNVTPQSTILTWQPLNDAANWSIFTNTGNTAGTIAAAVTGTGVGDVVTATNVGTGFGIINQATFEEVGDSEFYYELTDGIQYIESVTTPVTVINDYIFTFKGSIATDLASNSDWANEVVRLVPVTAQNCVDWLGSTSVSGLGSVASVERSTRGTKVQISTDTIGSIGSVKVNNSPANKIIVPVQGGGLLQGDSFTLYARKSLTQNLVAGSKVLVQNSLSLTKPGPMAILPSNVFFSGGNGLVGSTTDSLLPVIRNAFTDSISFEKISDKLCLVSGWAPGSAEFSHDGGWVFIDRYPNSPGSVDVSSTNQGLFRIIEAGLSQGQGDALDSGFLVVENPNAVDQNGVSCVINALRDDDSLVLPGDFFSINSEDVAGSTNVGKRRVVSVGKAYAQVPAGGLARVTNVVTVNTPYWHGLQVGDTFTLSPGETLFPEGDYVVTTTPSFYEFTYADVDSDGSSSVTQYVEGFDFQSPYIFRLDTATLPVQDAAMDAASGDLTNISEGTPQAVVKRILGITPSQTQDSLSSEELMAIKLFPANNATASTRTVHAGEHAGTTIIPFGKFDFSTDISVGLDGYHYSGGLIGELSKVLYGVESNPIAYPGVLAGGTSLGISGPLVKRILVDMAIRLKVGVMPSLVINKVKSAVAAAINKTAVGEDIALSDLVEAANQVVGVVSVVLKSPVYNLSNDVIKVQSYEKALILDVANDIKVSLLGD